MCPKTLNKAATTLRPIFFISIIFYTDISAKSATFHLSGYFMCTSCYVVLYSAQADRNGSSGCKWATVSIDSLAESTPIRRFTSRLSRAQSGAQSYRGPFTLNLNQTHIHKERTVATHLYPLQLPLNFANSLKRRNTFFLYFRNSVYPSLEWMYIFKRA